MKAPTAGGNDIGYLHRRGLFARIVTVAVTAVLALLATSSTVRAQAPGPGGILTVGKTDAFTSRAERQLRPLASYLGQQLSDVGIETSRTTIAADPESLARAMNDGKIDVVFDSPFPFMVCRQKTEASPILLGNQGGAHSHRSHIFVRRDSGIEKLSDLRGRIVAFENHTSTLEYFLPKILLRSRGLQLRELASPEARPRRGEVGYVLAGSQLNISAWVFYGKVDGGALSSAVWAQQEHNPAAYRREFRVISETVKTPHLVVAVRADMDARLRSRITEELLNMHLSPLGVAALKASGIDYFTEPEPDAFSAFDELVSKEADSEI